MSADEQQLWLVDPTVEWRILLAADLAAPMPPDHLERDLAALNRRLSDGSDVALVRRRADDTLLGSVARSPSTTPFSVGLDETQVVIAGEHQFVDGLGMLTALTELTGVPATSGARGVGERPEEPFVGEVARRLLEVALRPPARVARTGDGGAEVPRLAGHQLDRRVGTAELVHAAVLATVEFNRARGVRHRRVAVAVGASTVGGEDSAVADRSALLRLRSAERVDLAGIRTFLGSAPTKPSPGRSLDGSSSLVQRAGTIGMRVLGPRLGSTLTVSHLGDVTSPVEALAFYPVAGGSSGVALGAVTLRGRTHVTVRGRGDRHSQDGLEALLALVVAQLARPDSG